MQGRQKYKLALIINYFGEFPPYFSYFLQSCGYNTEIDFIIFTDADYCHYQQYDNIIFISSSLSNFNRLSSKKIGLHINIKSSYKICDFKPMYGLIYEDYLRQYSHWGYCDIDIIFGDLSKCITPDLLHKYDIISSHHQYMSGAFSVYKNTKNATMLFTKSKDLKKVLLEDEVFLFDEASNVIDKLWLGYNLSDFVSEVESMSHIISSSDKHNLSVKYANIITEKLQSKVIWKDGCLIDDGNELSIFHFLIYKSSIYFHIDKFTNKREYAFMQYGIFLNSVYSYTVCWFISILNNFRKKVRNKLIRVIKIKNK
ncbi:hypothetical protein F1C16_07930 [Hymenobacter sp. NBH84]|uniref:DUF6625 family protein n=1 Tax=Hymenobacter sp. NBH84 TaxID=2596915 RepID=UPI0016231C71|nr:DUF6625 family protein [Hymenobacter sp. NBH84]QNE39484.1 hypothetical protein F1C16_07930 [Hymenobacter sp. NBH84]